MSLAGDLVIARATALVQHCEHTQSLLRVVLEAADDGLYDPVSDRHSLRLPGPFIRTVRDLLEPPETPQT